ncbi:WD40/YVTN/BNR-like repeat-containing protein [Halococcus sediminicola]|uniref:WD40/YVTN/BNR-like repeat-containing protein n=1 Tax=Halococcus sediminicola TaxID=1264579 RepID=UPI0006785155|nr:hypothetical protein [Halococcus sediminicola]
MAESSTNGGSRGFFAYYRQYARSGVHAASAAALTAFGLWASFTGNRWFILLAIAVYILPPIFLYLTGEGENVPSVVGDDTADTTGYESGGSGAVGRDDSTANRDFGGGSSRTGIDEDETEPESTVENRGSRTAEPDDTAVGIDEVPSERGEESKRETGRPSDADSTDNGASATDAAATGSDTTDVESGGMGTAATIDEIESDTRRDTDASGGDETDTDPTGEPSWDEADTPTEEPLLDVVSTGNGAYAVGENGVVLARGSGMWKIALEDGPTANANTLRGVDATDDGEAIWFAGDSGVLGRYTDGKLTDHSAPRDQTSTWEDVAVTGDSGDERVHLVNGSGELLRGTYEDGTVSWDEIEKPGSGSSISSIAFVDGDRGHLCDTNQSVYETTNGGESYEEIGIEDANAAFTDVAASDSMVVVTADDGSLFRYDGAVWTRLQPSDGALAALALVDGAGFAAGGGGAVYERTDGGWKAVDAPTDADLRGIAIGSEAVVAVGSGGTAVERTQ